MSGVGFTEVVVLFVIGLLILGPERLPRVASQIGRWVGKARRTANQLRYQLEREVALADIEETRKSRQDKKPSAQSGESSTGADAPSAQNSVSADDGSAAGAQSDAGNQPPEQSGESSTGAAADDADDKREA